MMQQKASPGKAEPELCWPKMLMCYTGAGGVGGWRWGGVGIGGVVQSCRGAGDPTAQKVKLACALSLELPPHLPLLPSPIPI